MPNLPLLSGAALLVPLLALPGAALAELRAADLWADWQSAAAAQGVALTSETVTETGTGLTLRGVATVLGEPATGIVRLTVPELQMTESGDGTVRIAMPEPQTLSLEPAADADEEAPAPTVLSLDTTALTTTASGTREDPRYDFAAPAMALELTGFDPGEAEVEGTLSVDWEGIEGRVLGYGAGSAGPVRTLLEAAQTRWSARFTSAAEDASIALDGAQEAMVTQSTSDALGPDGLPVGDGRTQIVIDSGPVSNRLEQTAGDLTRISETRSETFGFRAHITAAEAIYSLAAGTLSVSFDDPALPVRPVSLSIEEADMAIAGPVAPSDDPQPFDLTLELIRTVPDTAFWTLLDPTGVLPREPITLEADIAGLALLGPSAALPGMAAGETADFMPTELTVNRLDLRYGAAGAAAEGAFTILQPDAPGGAVPPQPVGALDIVLRGIPELLQQLASAGVLPQEQMMGVQMMLGMFAAPQPDGTMTSRIETRADGSLFVNGTQLR